MRKALSVLLLIVLLAPAALAQSDEVVTIRVWGGWGHFRETTFQRVVEAFEAAHPNIRVEQQQVTGDMEGLMVQLLGGVAPDVYMVRAESMPLFISEGLAMDITPFVERDLNSDDYLPGLGPDDAERQVLRHAGGGRVPGGCHVHQQGHLLKAGIPIPSPDPNEALTFDGGRA